MVNEIKDDAGTPVSLQAVKLLARYLSEPSQKEIVLLTLNEWLTQPQVDVHLNIDAVHHLF